MLGLGRRGWADSPETTIDPKLVWPNDYLPAYSTRWTEISDYLAGAELV